MRVIATIGFMLLVACGSSEPAAAPLDPDALNILFIGNSLTYTNDLPGMVEALIAEAGAGPVDVRSVAYPNFGLEDHWLNGVASAAIAQGPWDYVVMQQGPSATEGRPSLLEYASRFAELIRAAGGEPALYMVWPSDARSFDWDGVLDSYATAAAALNGVFLPAGEAWRVAWETDPSFPFYGADRFHPNVNGTYLAALVIVERLAGLPPVGLARSFTTPSGAPVTIAVDTAALLQQAAAKANAQFAESPSVW